MRTMMGEHSVLRDMNIKIDFVATSELELMMRGYKDDPTGRKRLFFFLRYIREPFANDVMKDIKKNKIFSFAHNKKRKHPLELAIWEYYRYHKHGEYSMRSVNKVVKEFNKNPEDYDNMIALAVVGQITEIEGVDRDAFERMLEKHGNIARFIFFGDKMLDEETLRMNPEIWVVKQVPRIRFKKKRKRREI